jgi:outer membrane PBP1 activator LpoA protein
MFNRFSRHSVTLLAISAAALFLAGCETMPGFETAPKQPEGAIKAMGLAQQGDHIAASEQYELLATTASASQKQRYLLFSARELYFANELSRAERAITAAGTPIANSNLPLWAEVVASIRLAQDEPEAALKALNRVMKAPTRQGAIRILELRGDSLFRLGRQQAAVATLVRREELLQSRNDRFLNHQLIWENLERSENPISTLSIESATDPVVAGWLALAQVTNQQRGSVDRLRIGLLQWQETHPMHPANADLLPELLGDLEALSNYPSNVAVLLPLSGKQQVLGETIRDGYLSAVYTLSEANARPDIRFYDTASSSATAAYNSAIRNGAVFVVGPLLKEEVNEIAAIVDTVTTLALNDATIDGKAPAKLYQFPLAPEDEARSIARRAVAEGWKNAVALAPNNSWGERVYAAFQDELNRQGGQVLEAQAYPTDSPDYTPAITNALLLNESAARRDRLAANLGKQLEYEPRRRQDVDFIFVAANAPTAKLLKPQLKFHYAGSLPTFATSSVYIPGSTENAELDGIIFPDAPWLINPTAAIVEQKQALQNIWGANAEQRARFFALGYDAYQLTALLNGRSGRFEINLEGMTGNIMMDRDGLLHRDMDFARIKDGQPQLLPRPVAAAELPVTPEAMLEPNRESQPPAPRRSPITIISPGAN